MKEFTVRFMIDAVQKILDEGLKIYALQPQVRVVDVTKENRIILSYIQDPNFPQFHEHMIKLERYMKHALHTKLELRLETKEDKNKRDSRTERT